MRDLPVVRRVSSLFSFPLEDCPVALRFHALLFLGCTLRCGIGVGGHLSVSVRRGHKTPHVVVVVLSPTVPWRSWGSQPPFLRSFVRRFGSGCSEVYRGYPLTYLAFAWSLIMSNVSCLLAEWVSFFCEMSVDGICPCFGVLCFRFTICGILILNLWCVLWVYSSTFS